MRAQGFLEWAEGYVSSNPGHTAKEIARRCLDLGIVSSAAQNPEASLIATLQKHHADHGKIVRRKESGAYRFYPIDSRIETPDHTPDAPSTDRITREQLEEYLDLANQLVRVGKFKNQTDALVWLIQK